MLKIDGATWFESSVAVTCNKFLDLSVSQRTASFDGSGPVRGVSSRLSTTGRRSVARVQIDGVEKRRWKVVDRLPDGSVVQGEGAGRAVVQASLSKADKSGRSIWTRRVHVASKEIGALEFGLAARAVRVAQIETSLADGGALTAEKRIWRTAEGAFLSIRTKPSGGVLESGSDVLAHVPGHATGHADRTGSREMVTTYLDGSVRAVRVTETAGPAGRTESIVSRFEGSRGIESHSATKNFHTPGGMSWRAESTFDTPFEKRDGTSTRKKEAFGEDGSYSKTEVTIDVQGGSGTIIIDTITRAADGRGSQHTTVTDLDGNVKSDETHLLPGYGTVDDEDPGGAGGEDGGDDGTDDGDDGGDGGDDDDDDGDDGTDGGDDGDGDEGDGSGGDDPAGGGDDGGESGDWDDEGGGEEGPSLPPQSSGASIDIVLGEHEIGETDDEWGSEGVYGAAIGRHLNDAAQSAAPTHLSGSGWGDAGSERGTDIRAAAQSSGVYVAVGATDGWDGTNPRALIASFARLTSQMAGQTSGSATFHVMAASTANLRLGGQIGRVLARAGTKTMPT
ncbi:MAG TPA: hypothetical protein VGC51_14285 [Hansschlegelia sp.]